MSKFVPGARVAVSGWYDGTREAFVEKVYKNGRFTLRGSPQQWRPYGAEQRHAVETGDGWTRRNAEIWDEESNAQISAKVAKTRRASRLVAIQNELRKRTADTISDEQLAAIKAALDGAP